MKLRNKKTGDIINVDFIYPETAEFFYPNFKLVDFNELFEDYEEPTEFWFIDDEGGVEVEGEEHEEHLDEMRSIGNYFKTKEEAEKAVEKLKAWKRLKDAGFKFEGIDWRDRGMIGDYEIYARVEGEVCSLDLDLLFGGKEC